MWCLKNILSSVQFSSVAQSCPVLCDPMDCSTPEFPVHHRLPVLTQTHVHQVDDASQPSHLLLSPSPPTFNLSQYQGLFKRISSLHQVAKVLELQHHSFQWIFKVDFLKDWVVWSPYYPRDSSRVFSSIPIQKHQFFSTQPFFMVQLSHPYTTTGKTIALTIQIFVGKEMALLLIHCLHLSQLSFQGASIF